MKITKNLLEAVEKYKSGNKDAFTIIYNESNKYIYICIRNVVNGNNNAEDLICDIMQDTYLEISKSIYQLNDSERFLSWAGMIATRKCYAYLRKNNNYVLLGEENDLFDSLADDDNIIPEEIVQNREKQRLIREIIDKELNEMQKLCITAYYYNEMKQSEIAQAFGIPENTVKTHLSRAKAKIKAGVVDLEKNKDTKLYSLAPVLFLLFAREVEECVVPEAISASVKQNVQTAITDKAQKEMTKEAAKKAAKKATTSLKIKLAIGTVAGLAVIGGAVALILVAGNQGKENKSDALSVNESVRSENGHHDRDVSKNETEKKEAEITPLYYEMSQKSPENIAGYVEGENGGEGAWIYEQDYNDTKIYGLMDFHGFIIVKAEYDAGFQYANDEHTQVIFKDSNDKADIYNSEGELLYSYQEYEDMYNDGREDYLIDTYQELTESGEMQTVREYKEAIYREYSGGLLMETEYHYLETESQVVAVADIKKIIVRYINIESGDTVYTLHSECSRDSIVAQPDPDVHSFELIAQQDYYGISKGDGRGIVLTEDQKLVVITKDGYTEMDVPFGVHVPEEGNLEYVEIDVANDESEWTSQYISTTLELRKIRYSDDWIEAQYTSMFHSGTEIWLYNVDTGEIIKYMDNDNADYAGYCIPGANGSCYVADIEGDEVYWKLIIKGEKVIEEEYTWYRELENYIVMETDNRADVFDYNGKLCATFKSIGEFHNGKALVSDDKGAYYVNEKLEKASDYIIKSDDVKTGDNYIIDGNGYYMVKEKE